MWTYVVLSMIFNLVVSRARRTRRDDDGNEIEVSKCSKLVYRLSAPVYNVVYGTIVIHGSEQCADIKQTGLWVIAQMTYYISMVIIIAIIALLLAETLTVPSDSLPVDLHEAEELPAARDTHASTALPRAEAVPVFSDAVLAIGVTLAVSVDQISIAQATEVQEASVIV